MPIHDSPLVLTKKHVTSKTLPKQNEELLENALILSMLKSSEQIRSLERAVQRIPSTSSESKADVQGTHQSFADKLMLEPSFIQSIARGTQFECNDF